MARNKRKKRKKPADCHALQCPCCGARYWSPNVAARRVTCGRCGCTFYDWYKRLLIGQGYDDFWNFKGRYCVCKGSRGSKKSKTAALWHIAALINYPETNALVVRKTERTLKDSCFADLRWAIRRLGVESEFKCTLSPLEITRVPTGQKILFRGFDDPLKLTSITVPSGYLTFCWLEEAYEITKEKDFDTLDESIRGQLPPGLFKRFTITFNPWNQHHWLKKRFFDADPDPDILAMTTNYTCNEWLEESDLRLFEKMKQRNPQRYRVAGLGEWGIAEGLIYENWREDAFDIEAIRQKPGIKAGFGLDFGYSVDPSALCCFFVDTADRIIYVYDELYEKQLTNPQLYAKIEAMGYRKERIVADAAEPKSISELRDLGMYNIRSARKGPDSIRHGIQRLQDFHVVVHPRCVNFITEISNYTWATDKNGNPTQQPVDEMNHLMDAWRYGAADLLKKPLFDV